MRSLISRHHEINHGYNLHRVFGVGPTGLTLNTVQGETVVPTVLDNLYASKAISNNVLGVFFKQGVSVSPLSLFILKHSVKPRVRRCLVNIERKRGER